MHDVAGEEGLRPDHLPGAAQLFDRLGLALVGTDGAGLVRLWNDRATDIYGWSRAQALDRSVLELNVGPAERAQAEEIMAALTQGQRWAGQFVARAADGTAVPVYVIDLPLFAEDGGPDGALGVSFALDGELGAGLGDQLRVFQQEQLLEERVRQQERAQLRERLHRDVGQYATLLRTELFTLAARSDGDDGAVVARGVGHTDALLDALHGVLDDLEEPSGYRSGVRVQVESLVAAAAARCGWDTSMEGLAVLEHLPADDALAKLVVRFVHTAVDNVQRHAHARRVEVRCRRQEGSLHLEVADDGVGAQGEQAGHGLGLVAQQVAAHGGALGVDTAPGAGLRLQLEVPW